MTRRKAFAAVAAPAALVLAGHTPLAAQVETEVPPAVPGAKTVAVERIQIHGSALEGTSNPGTHTSAVAVRFQNHVLPFFSETLCAAEGCQ